ncbi:MAG: hypothetical protein FJ382_12050 [Verrucomicrobia bacterium]|nr:hypothetical protein [Verrucomicrobiota bacterium]
MSALVRPVLAALAAAACTLPIAAASSASGGTPFPLPLEAYTAAEQGLSLGEVLRHRISVQPFNLVASGIFLLAILHTFCSPKILSWAHHAKEAHEAKLRTLAASGALRPGGKAPVSFKAEMLHFFGEVEALFGLWVLPLLAAITMVKGWEAAQNYVTYGVKYTEPLFVVVIMAIAATRPILRLSESILGRFAALGGSTPLAWWFSILTLAPLLGSFITEPAAMTIAALLLRENFYRFNPSLRLRYATLGLLFVNISVGGTLTHFAAPPVLMVAAKWGWDTPFMLQHFGWKAAIGIVISNLFYYAVFRREFKALAVGTNPPSEDDVAEAYWANRRERIPAWITTAHLCALAWTVFTAHYIPLFLGGFLVFLAFTHATAHHQDPIGLRSPVLVGFFLAGLVVHGSLQQWWIAPVLGSLSELPLKFGAIFLTAFNDNAAITYLASLVPGLTPELKYAVVSGAVIGGGLTVIANAPNPAGQSILSRCFPGGVSPLSLFLGALAPTAVMTAVFLLTT